MFMQIAAGHIAELVTLLKEVELICSTQAAFWEYQADKFSSFSSQVTSAQDFIEDGVEEAVKEMVQWLKKRKEQLERYHMVMLRVSNSYIFATSVKPSPLPPLTLPSLKITLQ